MSGIVVGIDGSEGSKHALAWAAKEARLRGAALKLVAAWQLPVGAYGGLGWSGIGTEMLEDYRKSTEDGLDELCTEYSTQLDGLTVECIVMEGVAASVLVAAAADADLLVVGTRGHGGFAGLLLGSVSQQCAQHSRCPVVIIPPSQDQ